MRVLLDTHVFIWWDDDPTKLSNNASAALGDVNNELYLSPVSVWEIQIKSQLGKMTTSVPLAQMIQDQQARNGLRILPIELAHIFQLEKLVDHHKDPFDRLLISTAVVEDMTFVTHDTQISHYKVKTLW